jgi:hypothetical protein
MSLKLKGLVYSSVTMAAKKKGEKLRLYFFKLLKTHTEKMPAFRLSMIFMKTNELSCSFQDVDENKVVSLNFSPWLGRTGWSEPVTLISAAATRFSSWCLGGS